MNNKKERIISDILQDNFDELLKEVSIYSKEYSNDNDAKLFSAYVLLLQDKVSEAVEILLDYKKAAPFDVDAYYLLGISYMYLGGMYLFYSLKNFYISLMLSQLMKNEYLFFNKESVQNQFHVVQDLLIELRDSSDENILKEYNKQLHYYIFQESKGFCITQDIIRNQCNILGKNYYLSPHDVRFCSFYNPRDMYIYSLRGDSENNNIADLFCYKTEILKIIEEGKSVILDEDCRYLLPVAIKSGNSISVKNNDNTFELEMNSPNHFNYFPFEGKVFLESENSMVIGAPVKLGHSNERKKLVLSLFIDGLSQFAIKEYGLENIMPNTAGFFSKGVIFENAFTSSDWTYPSLASYLTGMEVPDHLMVKSNMTVGIPSDAVPYFKYLKNAGYYTTVISGDWRACISDGYFEDIDCYIAQHLGFGMKANTAIGDAIEHIEAFSNTDQFVWLCTGELHDVADGYDLPVSVQTRLPLKDRIVEEYGETSAKQNYSIKKENRYIEYIRQVDRNLASLYSYIEKKYSEDEFVVSIFADHGQTYLTKPGEHRMSRAHSNVAFMVRGSGYKGISKDYVSAIDYPNIICKLANAPYEGRNLNGMVPISLGGEFVHDFVISEVIHPNDPYMVALRNKEHTFYFTSENKFDNYIRIEWGNYECYLETDDGERFEDIKLKDKYILWVKDHIKHLISY